MSLNNSYNSQYHQWFSECINIINANDLLTNEELIGIVCSLFEKRKRNYLKKKYWVAEIFKIRPQHGFDHAILPSVRIEDLRFKNYFRLNAVQFEDLLKLVASIIQRQFIVREPIGPEQRLALTLRYLASGDTITSMSYQYLVGVTTASNIIADTCDAIWTVLNPMVLKPYQSEENWKNIANDFEHKWQFPHCLGAIDGKHVIIQCPNNSGSQFYNYKGSHSIVLLAVCDANYTFKFVEIGACGRRSDGGTFRESIFGQMLRNDELHIPEPQEVYQNGPILPYVIVGDEAFPLMTNLLRPYSGRQGLSTEQRIFNYRLSRARRTIENTFGILASQWRIYRSPIISDVQHVMKMVQATIFLHNYLRNNLSDNDVSGNDIMNCEESNEILIDESSAFQSIGRCSHNNYTREAMKSRDDFSEYFDEEGAVPWQFLNIYN